MTGRMGAVIVVSGIFLIAAPFVGKGGLPSEDIESMAHVDLYERAIPQAIVRRLVDRDHQLNENLSELTAVTWK